MEGGSVARPGTAGGGTAGGAGGSGGDPAAQSGLFSQSLDRLKESFLFAAAQGGNSEDVQSLLEIGADIDWRGQGGDTSLLAACRRGHCDTMALLTVHGANVNVVGSDGMSCIHIAARRGDIASLNVLLEADCNIGLKDKDGKTALDIAKAKGHEEIAARLVQYRRGMASSTTGTPGTHIRDIVRQAHSDDKAVAAQALVNSPRRGARPPSSSSKEEERDRGRDRDRDSKSSNESMSTSAIASALGVDLNAAPKSTSSSSAGGGGGSKAVAAAAIAAAGASSTAAGAAGPAARPVPTPAQNYAIIGTNYADATHAALNKLLDTEQRERRHAEATAEALVKENAKLADGLAAALDETALLTSELACVQRELDLLKGKKAALEAPSVTLETCAELDRVLKIALENVEARKSTLLLSSIEQQKEQRLCVICQEREKSVVLLPCRHLCLCETCSSHDDLGQCPLCRRPIAHRISVFA